MTACKETTAVDQRLTTGSRLTRTDLSVTVTTAPFLTASSIFGQMPSNKRRRVETLFSNPYHRWIPFPAGREQGVEIRIKCDADARLGPPPLQNGCIVGATHPDFRHMNHVPSAPLQQAGGGPRKTLIEQEAAHTGSRGCTLSSRFRAANSSAWRISSASSSGYSCRRSSQSDRSRAPR